VGGGLSPCLKTWEMIEEREGKILYLSLFIGVGWHGFFWEAGWLNWYFHAEIMNCSCLDFVSYIDDSASNIISTLLLYNLQ
jgi:hypothetical protein